MSSKHVRQKIAAAVQVPVPRCPESGKIQYRTRRKALRENGLRPVSADAYLCRHCGLWHVTRRKRDAA